MSRSIRKPQWFIPDLNERSPSGGLLSSDPGIKILGINISKQHKKPIDYGAMNPEMLTHFRIFYTKMCPPCGTLLADQYCPTLLK